MTIYYAHSLHLYNKPQEQRDVELLEKLGFEVINPNCLEYQEQMNIIKEKWADVPHILSEKIMEYCVEIVKGCDALAFRAHPNGKIPGGVGKEVFAAVEANKLIIELPSLLTDRVLSVYDTRAYLYYLGER